MILSLKNVSFRYSTRQILDHADFVVNEKEKWGVVGTNGSGKSTLLKIMAEKEKVDSGEFNLLRKFNVSYCPQSMEFEPGYTILETVKRNLNNDSEEYQIRSILNRLGLENHDEMIDVLSGGQKKKVALAIALIKKADLYLFDEPTNHLDQDMIVWLEEFISKINAAVVLVTHDRYFLSRITNHMVEIDEGKLYSYEGNYADYLEQREIRYQQALAKEQKRQNFLRREIEWIRAGAPARSTKQKGRIQRYEAVRDQSGPTIQQNLELKSANTYLGKKTIELNSLSKSYGDNVLFSNLTYSFLRDDRVGVIGYNGCGKSTLLKIIMGEVTPDFGEVIIGETVKIGYFAQTNEVMDGNKRIIDYLKEFGEIVYTADGEAITASQMLERFLFKKDDQYNTISRCSGGEKRRLYLCSILMQAPNVLLLDEPTNDLDTHTLTILENYLEEFNGIVIAVSHDRYFLDRTIDRLLVFEDNNVHIVESNYSTYLNNRKNTTSVKETKEVKEQATKRVFVQTKPLKLSSNEKKELEKLEKKMPLLDEEIKELESSLSEITDYKEIASVSDKIQELKEELEMISLRWMELAERQG